MAELAHYSTSAEGTATITLDSAPNRNALSAALLRETRAHLAAANADPAVRVVVLDHTGDVFCSGMDLASVGAVPAAEQPVRAVPALLRDIMDSPTPVIAKVGGKARAGGIGLLGACDIAIGSDAADFAINEVRLGLVGAVITVPLRRRMAPRAIRELYLTGEVFDAARAERVGLLDRRVPAAELNAEVARYAGLLAAGAPSALAAVKRLLADPPGGRLDEQFGALAEISATAFAGPDGQEGTAAWREKRPARWVPAQAPSTQDSTT